MDIYSITIVLVSGLGLGLCVFLSIHTFSRKYDISEYLLALLFIFLSLRITKSVFYNFVELPLFIRNFGLAFSLAIGPTLLLYSRSLFVERFRFSHVDAFHFLPMTLYLVFANIIPNGSGNLFWQLSYGLILLQLFVYLGVSVFQVSRQSWDASSQWLGLIISFLTIIHGIYFLIHTQVIENYAIGVLTFSGLMVFMATAAIIRMNKAGGTKRKNNYDTSLNVQQASDLLEKVKLQIEDERLYLKPNLTLSELAGTLNIPARHISQSINSIENVNFVKFIARFRLEEAKRLLSEEELKITSVAYASGFKSISTFNNAFKSHFQLTPSEFRKQHTFSLPDSRFR